MKFKKYDGSDLQEYTYNDEYTWQFIADVAGDNADLFQLDDAYVDNNDIGRRLQELGAVTKGVQLDPESCCFYAYFKTKADGVNFLKKLSAYLSQKAHLLKKASEY